MFTHWNDMDRLFYRLFGEWMPDTCTWRRFADDANLWGANRMNLVDKGDNLEFVAELSGVQESDIDLSVVNDTLKLSAKRTVSHDGDNTLYLSERSNYDIQRSIALPARVDVTRTKATFKNGILRVVFAKAEENKPRQIAING